MEKESLRQEHYIVVKHLRLLCFSRLEHETYPHLSDSRNCSPLCGIKGTGTAKRVRFGNNCYSLSSKCNKGMTSLHATKTI